MTTKKTTTAPRAAYADKPVTPLINSYCDWIEREVGITLNADARRAVYLGSALRNEFQKANREATASKTTKAAPAPSRRRRLPQKGSTIATAEGVVIAEQRHIEANS